MQPHPLCLAALSACALAAQAAPTPDFVGGTQGMNDAPPAVQRPSVAAPLWPARPADAAAAEEALGAQPQDQAAFLRALQSDPLVVERLINAALAQQRWDWLAFLLPLYRAMPAHDAMLADFAQGALLRAQGRHDQAIALYRGMVAAQPQLVYVRMNLALMLLEDRQPEAAAEQLRKVMADDSAQAQVRQTAQQHLAALQQQQRWRWNLGLNHERTDNVNNASADPYIMVKGRCLGIWGHCLEKDADSLPQTAEGLRYSAGVSRQWNVTGRHYGTLGVDVNGIVYRGAAQTFDERSVRVQAGYGWRSVHAQLSLAPYVEQMWLDRETYSRSTGVLAEAAYGPSPRWQWSASADWARTRYEKHTSFDGERLTLQATAVYMPSAVTMCFGGVDATQSGARNPVNAWHGRGVRVGASREWPLGISTLLLLRYGQRDYRAPMWLYGYRRHDREYNGTLTLWHRAMSLWGVTPKLNVQYNRVDSNMASLFSRQSKRVFVSLEKTF